MGILVSGKNDLTTLYPKLAIQWHPTLNGDTTPDMVSAHCNKKYYWLCDKGHSFDISPDKRVNGQNCPYCNNRRLLLGYNDLITRFPDFAKEWDYEKNEKRPEEYTYRSTEKVSWICSSCGKHFEAKIRDRVDSQYGGCPVCTAIKRGENRRKTEIDSKGGITDPLLLKEWDYSKNKDGPDCFRPQSNKYAYWICSKCGYHYKAKINNRSNGRKCACCAGKVVVPGINDLATTHPQLAAEWHPTKNGDLSPQQVTAGRATKIWWLCPEGHEYPASLLHRSGGTNCPECVSGRQTSFAEQAVYYYVHKVFPDAINRYTDIFKKGMELDIFIPSIRLGIEYDGEAWHKEDKLQREIKKYQICQKNNIKLLRLKEKRSETDRYTADEILAIDGNMYEPKHLSQVIRFLLDNIDPESSAWTRRKPIFHSRVDIDLDRDANEIRSYMTKIKGNSLAETYPEIAKEWHPTKNGALTPYKVKPHSDITVWWICPECGNEYPATIGHRTDGTGCKKCGYKKSAAAKMKKVEMIDPSTQAVIRIFDSITEASRELGINCSNISMVCKGERKKAGNYIWRYYAESTHK